MSCEKTGMMPLCLGGTISQQRCSLYKTEVNEVLEKKKKKACTD